MLRDVEILNFRSIARANFALDDRLTAVLGCNGAGKTSMLEALYLLGHGRSHRTADRRPMIRREDDFLRVIANVDCGVGDTVSRIGLELRRSGEMLASVDQEQVRTLTRVLQLAPIVLIDGDVQGMFSLGATHRRRLVDWGVFHVERPFARAWREYQRALRQRNAALKIGSASQARMWDSSLIQFGEQLHAMRVSYVTALQSAFSQQMTDLLPGSASISYRCGWTGELPSALEASLTRDLQMGFTSVGPHRADFLPQITSGPGNQLSRGQLKLLAIGLLFAQVRVHATVPDIPQVSVLVDDAGADLDVDNLGKLYSALRLLPGQLVLTALDERALHCLNIGRMFHVEQGMIRLLP